MSDTVPFTDLAYVNPPLSVTVPSHGMAVSFIPMADVSDSGEWTNRQTRDVSRLSQGFTIFQENDVLFAKITPCMENGKGCYAKGLQNKVGFGSTEFIVLRAKNGNDPRFLFQWTRNPILRKTAQLSMSGSAGQQRVQPSFFSRFRVPLIPPDEQKTIAAILEIVDGAIRQTAAMIEKLKKIKAGLLHDLLTRGIDENGQLRDPIRHPERFKDSPLGKVPKEWDVAALTQSYAEPARNGLYKHRKHYGKGSPIVSMPQMFRSTTLDASDAVRLELTPTEAKAYALRSGDLLFARRSLNLDGAGKCCLVGDLPELTVFESSIIRVRLKSDFEPAFVNQFLGSELGFRVKLPFIRQVAVSGVSSKDVAQFNVPKPPVDEQRLILLRLGKSESRIAQEEVSHRKLTLIKHGLMQDLLTGRVRVPAMTIREKGTR